MALGLALIRLHVGPYYTLDEGGEVAPAVGKVLSWFLDTPAPTAPYSIHRITLLGRERVGKEIGEWYGPSTISAMLCSLVNRHSPGGLRSVLFTDQAIYRDKVGAACTGPLADEEGAGLGFPEAEVAGPTGSRDNGSGGEVAFLEGEWRPVLIWVSVRLGEGDRINPVYLASLASYFSVPGSLGVVGGNVKRAHFFVGVQEDTVFFLDPHTVQPAVPGVDEGLASGSYSTTVLHSIKLADADPSLTFAFFCRDRDEFERLCKDIAAANEKCKTPIILIKDKAPPTPDLSAKTTAWDDDENLS
jgi:cysteine protease ATG4